MEQNSYLKRLKFDPNLLNTFRAKYLTNIRVVLLLVFLIVVAGISSFISLPRRLNPEVKIPIVSVVTILPGASPKDIEELITNPIEDAVKGTKGISALSSSSNESVSTIIAEFNSNVDPDKAESDLKSAVDSVNDLPEDANEVQVRKFDFEDQPIWIFAVKSRDSASLFRFSKLLQERLENDTIIDRVTVSGLDQQEIQILADTEKINFYKLNPLALSGSIRALLASYPSGNIATTNLTFPIGLSPGISSIEDLRNSILKVNGQELKLSDIAQVSEKTKPDIQKAYIATSNTKAETVATFAVYKNTSATIDKAAEKTKEIVNSSVKPFNNTFTIVSITDASSLIEEEFGGLADSFRDTLILVFITFLVFLGIRQAIIAVLTIPLTFLVAFTVINASGLSLNFLTLFSLLLSLGLLVDDTIVVVTGMTSYYRTKKFTPLETGLLVWKDLIVPIWSTTITTSWAFLPLLLSTGIIGEFIKTIPIVVATTLYASTTIAMLITIPLMIVILKLNIPRRVTVLLKIMAVIIAVFLIITFFGDSPTLPLIILISAIFAIVTFRVRRMLFQRTRKILGSNSLTKGRKINWQLNERLIDIEKIGFHYKRLILKILNSPTALKKVIAAVIIFSIFSFLLLPLGFVTNEFFPRSENDYIYVNLELPSGTNNKVATLNAETFLEKLRKTEGIEYVSAEIGRGIDAGAQDFKSGGNLVLFTLTLPEKSKRKIDSLKISENLREELRDEEIEGTIAVVELSGGPPVGAEVQVQLLGSDLAQLDNYADTLIAFLKKQSGVINATKSINPGTSKLTFVPNALKLSENGITQDSLGLWIRTFTTGLTFKSVKFGDSDSKDIIFRTSDTTQSPQDLSRLSIPNMEGVYSPLLSLGELKLDANPTTITHLDTKRAISVSASVSQGYSSTKVNQDLLKYVEGLNLPDGYEYRTGGANEENEKSVNSILQSMILAGLLILATMVIQFRSYRKALIVMLVIPIAVSGVFIVFALTGTPLSFPALIGVLSLFGIVVTHAMFLVDKFNRNIAFGLPLKEAVADGAASRLEPVFIGSFTTIVGLIPISLSNPLWRGLGGAIIAGLTFSGIIMLFFIPVVYYLVYRNEYKKTGK